MIQYFVLKNVNIDVFFKQVFNISHKVFNTGVEKQKTYKKFHIISNSILTKYKSSELNFF